MFLKMGWGLMCDVTQIERQLYILTLLSSNKKGYTISEIHDNLMMVGIEVSRRTIERDIDFMSMGSLFIVEEMRFNKTFYTAKKFGIGNMIFTTFELISLHFIKELLKSYTMLDIGNTAIYLIDRIIKDLPQLNKAYIEMLTELLKVKESYAGLERHLDEEIINIVRKGIEQSRTLLIKYHSFTGDEETERKFDPYIIEIYEGCYHLIGYCHLRESVRDLRISRIIEVKLLEGTYKRPKRFYENYKKDRFGKLAGEENIDLMLRFSGEGARYVLEYESAKADVLIEEDDGTILFQRTTTMTPEIIKWVLSFGADVAVIKPEAVREAVIKHAKGMLEKYEE